MAAPSPLTATRLSFDDDAAFQEHFHASGWTDGLPIVAPTADAVAAHLEAALLTPDHVVGIETVKGRAVTAEILAINSVMAGCRPEHFAAVVTAVTGMLAEPFLLHGATASTGGCAVLVVVNGPIRHEMGMDPTFNAIGPSDRAGLCVGRAVRLILRNVFDLRSGDLDRSTLGHPGKISYCIAEDEENTPWKSLGEERLGDPHASAVTVMAALGPRQIMNEWTTEPTEILDTFVAEIRANMRHYSLWSGNYAIVIPPQLRTHFDAAGWSKADIRTYVHEHARIHRREWAGVGKASAVADKGDREYVALESPDDLLVIAAGGPAGGFGAVIPPWLGTRSRAVTVAVGACIDC